MNLDLDWKNAVSDVQYDWSLFKLIKCKDFTTIYLHTHVKQMFNLSCVCIRTICWYVTDLHAISMYPVYSHYSFNRQRTKMTTLKGSKGSEAKCNPTPLPANTIDHTSLSLSLLSSYYHIRQKKHRDSQFPRRLQNKQTASQKCTFSHFFSGAPNPYLLPEWISLKKKNLCCACFNLSWAVPVQHSVYKVNTYCGIIKLWQCSFECTSQTQKIRLCIFQHLCKIPEWKCVMSAFPVYYIQRK